MPGSSPLVETLVTTWLVVSLAWARSSDIVCDGGRAEADKWFDGCRWCICQRSGPVCSGFECSHLVSLVAPCQKVGSRWLDGCYHCTCYHHGIECTVDDTCAMLMRSDGPGLDFLSHSACLDPGDGRCICGVDGVPSCTAEVIDRNAHRATSIVLKEILPDVSSILSSTTVHYDRPRTKSNNNRRVITNRPNIFSNDLYLRYQDGTLEKQNKQIEKNHHSLVKRHASRNRKHSPEVYSNNHRTRKYPKRKPGRDIRTSSSHNQSNSKRLVEGSFIRKVLRDRRRHSGVNSILGRHDRNSFYKIHGNKGDDDDNQLYPRKKWRDRHRPGDLTRSSTKSDNYKYEGGFQHFPVRHQKNARPSSRLVSRDVTETFRTHKDLSRWRGYEEGYLNDHPPIENVRTNSTVSLVIASANRCRWGVRWYGGSLRCFCVQENSITCGDPSFVASRIDGFRLEPANCEEGQTWEDNYCRTCECQFSGVALCRRSSFCSLPVLIKPLPMNPDDGTRLQRKGQESVGPTEEFTAPELRVVFSNDTKDISENKVPESQKQGKEVDQEVNVHISKGNANKTVFDEVDGKINGDVESTVLNLTTRYETDSQNEVSGGGNTDIRSKNEREKESQGQTESVSRSYVVSTSNPKVVSSDKNVNIKVGNNDDNNINNTNNDKGNKDSSNAIKMDKIDIVGENNSKRATPVKQLQCKPLSRWLDSCRRCQCDKHGQKSCDDSRCPKPIVTIPSEINTSFDDEDNRSSRPLQRPPPEVYFHRDGPINLKPPFLGTELCGRFAVGERFWDECNMCLCTQFGPKCTAKNCS